MSISDNVIAVLEFFRKNGFAEAELALKQDILEKGEIYSLDFEKFVFPMVPLPPPVRVPGSGRQSEVSNAVDCSDSSDEFVSLGGSSTTDVCNSDFTNPYGFRSSSHVNSEASSDRLSEFGTARAFHDLDMQNDLYWYDEKDEGCFMTPCFKGSADSSNCPSEDKFVMTLGTEKRCEKASSGLNHRSEEFVSSVNYLDKACVYNVSSMDDDDQIKMADHNHSLRPRDGAYDCSMYLFKCCREIDSVSENKRNSCTDYCIKRNSVDDLTGERERRTSGSHIQVDEKDCYRDRNCNYYEVGESHEPEAAVDEQEDTTPDEIPIDIHEDEYEVFNLRIIHRKNRTGFEENKDLPIILNSIVAGRYYITEYLGSAAFSRVVQAHDLHMGVDVCLKIIKNDKDFFDQSLDEIKLLKFVNKHDPADECHILRLYDYFYHQEHLFIVCELLRANLYEFQKFNKESGGEAYFTFSRLQVITRQCLEALNFMHELGLIHCDLKPENILIKSYKRCEIKVIDLGSSCFQTDNLCLYVQSRSYRAPEVILGLPYDQRIDIWSLGCILAELCSGEVLFPNDTLVMLLTRMIGMLGPIDMEMLLQGQETHKYFTKEYDLYHVNEETDQTEYIIPEETTLEHHLQVSDIGFIEFVGELLETNPKRRPTAREALDHPWLSHPYHSISC